MTAWEEFRQTSTDQVLAWAAAQPWAQAMAECAQDREWHAEGDVWTHTRMVMAEVERLEEWPTLDRDSQLKLLFTALFHDSGKPGTTAIDPASGHIRSHRHALAGVGICREALRQLGCDLETREEIARLVAYHGRPSHLLEKPDPGHELIRLSWFVNHRLLWLFALADTRGRITAESSRPEENMHLWRMVAEENRCFDGPYAFANDHAKFLFYRGVLSSLHYVPQEEYRCTVTMMSGLPGSGKDTWLLYNHPNLPVVSLDDIRVHLEIDAAENQGEVIQAAREQCRVHLRAGRDFAFNGTNTVRQTRKRWIDLFAEYGARVELVYLEPPLPLMLQRNQRRPVPVPAQVIRHLLDKLEPPTRTEAHALNLIGSPRNSA